MTQLSPEMSRAYTFLSDAVEVFDYIEKINQSGDYTLRHADGDEPLEDAMVEAVLAQFPECCPAENDPQDCSDEIVREAVADVVNGYAIKVEGTWYSYPECSPAMLIGDAE